MILLVLPWKQVALARYQLQQLQHLLQNPIAEWVPLLHPLLATQRVRASRRKLAQSTVLRFLTSPLILSRMTEGLESRGMVRIPGSRMYRSKSTPRGPPRGQSEKRKADSAEGSHSSSPETGLRGRDSDRKKKKKQFSPKPITAPSN